jgi:hypothetical protein
MSQRDTIIIKSKVLIIVSTEDIAGLNMKARLEQNIEFLEDHKFKPSPNWPEGDYQYFTSKICSLLLIPNNQIKTDYLKNTIEERKWSWWE